jgi:hypothetical protein
MPSLGVYFPEEEISLVEEAAKAANQKVAPYIADATRARLTAEGHLPGTPAHDIRAEALSAAEIAGADVVLAALRAVIKSNGYTPAAVSVAQVEKAA